MSHPCGSISVLRFRPCVHGHSYLSIQPGNTEHLIYSLSQFSKHPYQTGIPNPVCSEKQRLQNLRTAEQNLTIWLPDSKAGVLSCLSTKGNSSQPGSHQAQWHQGLSKYRGWWQPGTPSDPTLNRRTKSRHVGWSSSKAAGRAEHIFPIKTTVETMRGICSILQHLGCLSRSPPLLLQGSLSIHCQP